MNPRAQIFPMGPPAAAAPASVAAPPANVAAPHGSAQQQGQPVIFAVLSGVGPDRQVQALAVDRDGKIVGTEQSVAIDSIPAIEISALPEGTKQIFSGSTNGKGIAVAATSSPGTTIHTAVTGTAQRDEIWLYAVNTDSTDRLLTVEFGDTSAVVKLTIKAQSGAYLVIDGWPLNNGAVVKAFAATTNVIYIFGHYRRYS